MLAIALALVSQALFTVGDTIARENVKDGHFFAIFGLWYLVYTVLRLVAGTIQLYILSNVQLGGTYIIYAIVALLVSQAVGIYQLREIPSTRTLIALALVIVASVLVSTK